MTQARGRFLDVIRITHHQQESHLTLPAVPIAKPQVLGHRLFAEDRLFVVVFTGDGVRHRSGNLRLFLSPVEIQSGFTGDVKSLLCQPAE